VSARRDDLNALLAKVEAGEFNRWSTAGLPVSATHKKLITRAYNGSLNAAKALHEAVLPGWLAVIDTDGAVEVSRGGWPADATVTDDPARAWLIAILKALIAEAAL
jgi:hypothetical protein